jgi:metallo-beta-lactamase family protein
VTGSCHELQLSDSSSILIDCGLFQGAEISNKQTNKSSLEIDFPIDSVKALIVTHVHIDHVGRIPYLLAAGFKGPIICSQASAKLLPLVLEDAVKIGFTRNKQLIEQFIRHIKKQIIALPYQQWHRVIVNENSTQPQLSLKVKLKPAGHILGSAYVECAIQDFSNIKHKKSCQRVIFSGDLGAPYTPILSAVKSPYKADCVVIESTYGDKLHDNRQERVSQLKKVIISCLKNRGVILIPAFSMGRTQELLYQIEQIIYQSKNEKLFTSNYGKIQSWDDLEIIVDSPLASKFTSVYRQLKQFWDKEAKNKLKAGRHPLSFDQLTTIDDHQSHLQTVSYLAKNSRPTIVLAASGMCTGGRIVNYLKALIENPINDILFVGYQAQGTTGREIQQSNRKEISKVKIDGEYFSVKAKVHTISAYSAHADQKDLINFIRRIKHKPNEIRIVHGDNNAKQALKQKLLKLLPKINIIVP